MGSLVEVLFLLESEVLKETTGNERAIAPGTQLLL